jgi:hypothetical protein
MESKTGIDPKLRASKRRGLRCPIPGCRNRPTQWHHVFKRRPDHWYLRCDENMMLVCSAHHVPEAKDLGYYCTLLMFEQGVAPDAIEAWAEGGAKHFTVPIALPEFYYAARLKKYGH